MSDLHLKLRIILYMGTICNTRNKYSFDTNRFSVALKKIHFWGHHFKNSGYYICRRTAIKKYKQ